MSKHDNPYDWSKDPQSGYTDEEAHEILNHKNSNPPKRKKHHRVFLWFFLAVQLLFIIWIIAGAASAGSTPGDTGGVLTQEEANSARDAGTAIGIGLIIILWAIVDFILGIGYAIKVIATREKNG